jgi:hypothetical protein
MNRDCAKNKLAHVRIWQPQHHVSSDESFVQRINFYLTQAFERLLWRKTRHRLRLGREMIEDWFSILQIAWRRRRA